MTDPVFRDSVIFSAELSWEAREALQKMAPEKYAELVARLPPDRLGADQSRYHSALPWICDLDEAKIWDGAGIKLMIGKIRGVSYPVTPADAVRDALRGSSSGPTIINVSVANVGLYDVQEVKCEEDCCTDQLQALLNQGWRILAVCPPNDARRPTYIIGRGGAR